MGDLRFTRPIIHQGSIMRPPIIRFKNRCLTVIAAVTEALTIKSPRSRDALMSVASLAVVLSFVLLATAAYRREERHKMAAYYQQKAAESLNASRNEAYVADLAEGKVTSPILPFLNPIADPTAHRVAAAAHEEDATRYLRTSTEYEAAAHRPWRSVGLSSYTR